MATYRLKGKNFGLLFPFTKTAANWGATKSAFKAGNVADGFKNLGSTVSAIGVGKGLGVAAALGAGTFLAAENKANS